MRRLIGRDVAWNGVETRYYYDSASRKLIVQRLQDVDPQLNENVKEYNSHGDHKATRYKGSMYKAASIPPGVVEQWLKEGFNVFTASDKELRKRLNDPEYRKLRTTPGRL